MGEAAIVVLRSARAGVADGLASVFKLGAVDDSAREVVALATCVEIDAEGTSSDGWVCVAAGSAFV